MKSQDFKWLALVTGWCSYR